MAPTCFPSTPLISQIHSRQQSELVAYCVSPLDVVKNILSFFALNILAHTFTMLQVPGQKVSQTIAMAFFMIFSPVFARSAYSHAIWKTLSARWKRYRASQPTDHTFKHCLNFMLWGGNSEGEWGLQAAIDAGAVAIPMDSTFKEMKDWKRLDMKSPIHKRAALYDDGTAVEEDADLRYLPIDTLAMSSNALKVPPSSSLVQTVVAIAQLCYTSFELYASQRPQVSARGLSSPYIVVIPYLVMSLINLVINLYIGTYPYVTVLRVKTTRSEMETRNSTGLQVDPAQRPSSEAYDESSSSTPVPDKDSDLSKFAHWLENSYELQLPSTVSPSYHGEWLTVSTPVHLLISHCMITAILAATTRFEATDLFLTMVFLFWIYSGLVQYFIMLLLSVVNFLTGDYFGKRFGSGIVITVVVYTVAALIVVGPTCPGVYGAGKELWKYYSACTPAQRVIKPVS